MTGLFLLAALAGLAIPLWRRDALGQDWKYWDSYTLVVRSIVLHYRRAPLQDPWVMGGMDIPANPQSRIFSPSVLIDILVPPPFTGFVSIVAFSFAGAWGMYRLLRSQGVGKTIALAGALIFVHSTYFGLHFAEGHVTFESFLLLPWVLYLGIHAHRLSNFLALVFLLDLILLEGAMYPFIHGVVLLAAACAVGLVRPARAAARLRRVWKPAVLGLAAAALLAVAKIVPVLAIYGSRSPELDLTVVTAPVLAQMLLDPGVTIATAVPGSLWRFHEFGCYVGAVPLLIVGRALFFPRFVRRNRAWLLLLSLWLWVVAGWGYPFNPWWVFQRLPLVHNAHVQSRFLLLFHMAFVVVLCRAVQQLSRRWQSWELVPWALALEALVAKNYDLFTSYADYAAPVYSTTLITSAGVRDTLPGASKPWNYSRRNSLVQRHVRARPSRNPRARARRSRLPR